MSQALGFFGVFLVFLFLRLFLCLFGFFFYNALEKSGNGTSILQKRNRGTEQLNAFPEAR